MRQKKSFRKATERRTIRIAPSDTIVDAAVRADADVVHSGVVGVWWVVLGEKVRNSASLVRGNRIDIRKA